MSLGLCCQWMNDEGVNVLNHGALQLGKWNRGEYTQAQVEALHERALLRHLEWLPHIFDSGIRRFRFSASLLALADKVPTEWTYNARNVELLRQIGDVIKSRNVVVSTHPGQFVVLSSDRDEVVQRAIAELQMHAKMFDLMGLRADHLSAINIHGGKADRPERLIEVANSLPLNVKGRLTFENDESCYSVPQLLHVWKHTGVPVVLDTHHFAFNDGGISAELAHKATAETWPTGIRPQQHLSNTEKGQEEAAFNQRRKHSSFIHYVPECQLEAMRQGSIDVDIEATAKNAAIFRLVEEFRVPL